MIRSSEYDKKARFHSPAFDQNILYLDDLTNEIKNTYDDILLCANVRYDPPDRLFTLYAFKKEDDEYTVIVEWKAKDNYELNRLAFNVWSFKFIRSNWRTGGDILEDKTQVTLAYIFKKLGDYLA